MKEYVKIISIHPRKQHNLEQALTLYQLFGNNFRHITSIYFDPILISLISKFSKTLGENLKRRSISGLPSSAVKTLPSTEVKRQLAPIFKYYFSPYMQDRAFQQEVIKKISPPEICIAVDGSAYNLFDIWQGKSKLILDLSIALPQYYLVTEHGSGYNPTMLTETDEFHARLYNSYFKEIELADLILCGSEFVKSSIEYFRPELGYKCRVLPYGVNTTLFDFHSRSFQNKPNLKFVAVGTVDQRKGSDTLVAAWQIFSQENPMAELHFFGSVHDERIKTTIQSKNVFFHGRVTSGTLISELKNMDVFILPTLHEGSSIAVYQAMSMSLPIITTFNSGTVLIPGESYFKIPPKDVQATSNAMQALYENESLREKLGTNAYAVSKEYSWEKYKNRLKSILFSNTIAS